MVHFFICVAFEKWTDMSHGGTFCVSFAAMLMEQWTEFTAVNFLTNFSYAAKVSLLDELPILMHFGNLSFTIFKIVAVCCIQRSKIVAFCLIEENVKSFLHLVGLTEKKKNLKNAW
jgi:hypothetical protein